MIRLEKQDYLGKSKDELIEDLFEKIRENEKLKRKLRKYENPHTPPSKDERKSRTNFVSITGLAVGKKTGYKGATRERKEPTEFISSFDNHQLSLLDKYSSYFFAFPFFRNIDS